MWCSGLASIPQRVPLLDAMGTKACMGVWLTVARVQTDNSLIQKLQGPEFSTAVSALSQIFYLLDFFRVVTNQAKWAFFLRPILKLDQLPITLHLRSSQVILTQMVTLVGHLLV